jgi:uncharacterized protein YggU (UPF0235/DUF167 family)
VTRELATHLVIASHARGSALALTVAPRSSTNRLEIQDDGTLRARITAPPADGAANATLLRFLADRLDLPRTRLTIASGDSNRRKRIIIAGIDPADLALRLERALAER